MLRPLDIEAGLSLVSSQGDRISVDACGRVVRVALPNLWVPHRLFRGLADPEARSRWMARLRSGIGAADLEIQFLIAGRLVAELTPDSRESLLTRMLGLGPLTLRPWGIFLSLLRKQPRGPEGR